LSLAHFGHSRYAAGTPARDPTSGEKDGPLSDLGLELLDVMSGLTIALDLTHLGDTSFAQAIDRFEGPVCVTHANCRALADAPRQLSDRQLKAIIERGGVIGVVLHSGMIRWAGKNQSANPGDVTLRHLADHIDHLCQLAGSARHVALGSDLDGGFGRATTPGDFNQYRDLHALSPLLEKRGLSDADRRGFFYENWWRFYREVLGGGNAADVAAGYPDVEG
jgi:membrane dipeptidase